MDRRPKPDALTNAEHQRRHRARYDLVTLTIPRDLLAALNLARSAHRPKVTDALSAALAALHREDAEVARLPAGASKPARRARSKTSSADRDATPSMDLFGTD